jgi:type I restriction enzyme M protein
MSYELKERSKWENLISRIEKKEKELKKFRKELKDKEKELEDKIGRKREALSDEEAKEILLEKFYELINEQLDKYLNAEKKEIIKISENLWDKYKVSLKELKQERDEEVRRLDEFLGKLRYGNYEL